MSVVKRYFFADDPSPATDAINRYLDSRSAMVRDAKALAAEVGGTPAVTSDRMRGFAFSEEPPSGEWIPVGYFRDDVATKYYVPRRNSKARKALYARMTAIKAIEQEDVLRELGLVTFFFCPPYIHRSSLCYKNGRAYFVIPFWMGEPTRPDRDSQNITIPDWLTECHEWEMHKHFASEQEQAA